MLDKWCVNVNNIGNIVCKNEKDAEDTYKEYVSQSKEGYGRAAGESVALFYCGEIIKEYWPDGDEEE